MWPATKANSALPTDPAMPPIPTTDPTALRGNMSEEVVKRLADHPWWAPAARPINATAAHNDLTLATVKMGSTRQAQTNMAATRAWLAESPRRRKGVGNQPPPILPITEMLYTMMSGSPRCERFRLNFVLK